MKRSKMVEAMAEGILQTHFFGGSPEEREVVRKDTYMKRVIMADAALKAALENGMDIPIIYKVLQDSLLGQCQLAFREWDQEEISPELLAYSKAHTVEDVIKKVEENEKKRNAKGNS